MPAKLTKEELKQNLDNSLSSNSISKLYKVVEYPLNKKDIVSITCHLHGEQQKLYGSWVKKSLYPECVKEEKSKNNSKSDEEFEKEFNAFWNGTKRYVKGSYSNNRNPIQIYCPDCKDTISVLPVSALKSGLKCSCNSWTTNSLRKYLTDMYKDHPGHLEYDFSETTYTGSHSHIFFKCAKHGEVSRYGISTLIV